MMTTFETSFLSVLREGLAWLGWSLPESALEAMARYARMVWEWNERLNLTAIVEPEAMAARHFVDSLTALQAFREPAWPPAPAEWPPCRLADVGTGAGFPGLVLKLAWPALELTLIEATAKKARFLEAAVYSLGLEGIAILARRAEEVGQDPAHRECYDGTIARAVAELPVLLEYLLPLARIGGIAVAMKGAELEEEIAAAHRAMGLLGGRLRNRCDLAWPPHLSPRTLLVFEKIAPTPPRYPRRPGIPEKRPLR
ncbi:MAG: 16S rRNA (guanine(527)-N(7))-methyltransferase RsmG [Anaerolineae bacterium]|nr:16S rRNA (guanine(527)-N(7))-methyltransferase RsmG [Anaerolineae bacterium]